MPKQLQKEARKSLICAKKTDSGTSRFFVFIDWFEVVLFLFGLYQFIAFYDEVFY